jgi:aspartate racemase
VVATAGPVPDSAGAPGTPPIGRPIDNVEVHLLDAHGAPVPRGVVGELYLGGVQLARGYLNRPDLTGQRFVSTPGGRLYRTGDLARWRTDDQLEFLGRADRQVKIRGYRIEPGEIEARLREHPTVADAAVIADGTGDRRLVAYLTAVPGTGADVGELRRWLSDRLPDYMVPGPFLLIPELPTTSSGKVDRSRLPAPAREVPAPGHEAPRDDLERAIAGKFGEILGRDRVGINDSFFELGGHSLLASRLAAGLRHEFGVDLPMRTVFTKPTVKQLAVALVEAALADQQEGSR